MDRNIAMPNEADDRDALCAAGISAGLADLILEAFREHDAAGRPAIVLPSPEETILEHRLRPASGLPSMEIVRNA